MDDNEYVRRVRAMEGRLFRVAQAMLWRYADSADAVQEAVFRGWMKKGGLRQEEYFETWMMRILINECRSALRRRKRGVGELTVDVSADDTMCEDLHLRQALRALPGKYRLPLLLHHMEGYSLAETAEMLDMPVPRLNSRLYRARAALRELLDGGEEK